MPLQCGQNLLGPLAGGQGLGEELYFCLCSVSAVQSVQSTVRSQHRLVPFCLWTSPDPGAGVGLSTMTC